MTNARELELWTEILYYIKNGIMEKQMWVGNIPTRTIKDGSPWANPGLCSILYDMNSESLITDLEYNQMKVPIKRHLLGHRGIEFGYMAPVYEAAPRIRFVQKQINRLKKEMTQR